MNEQGAWLTILGIGEEGLDSLTPVARRLWIRQRYLWAESVIWQCWKRPTRADGLDVTFFIDGRKVLDRRGEDICILASGDPMCFGVGATFSKRIPVSEMLVVPGISSYSLACSRLGWAMMDVDMLTPHGRPLSLLHPHGSAWGKVAYAQ